MQLATLFEKVKAALKSPSCLHCAKRLPEIAHFCSFCRETLNLNQPQAMTRQAGFACHAATRFNPAVKKLIYGYKFYGQTRYEAALAGLLTSYWEQGLSYDQWGQWHDSHPESTLVITIPPHQNRESRVNGFSRRFSRTFGYDFKPDILSWRRDIAPQHSLNEKAARFANLANSLQARPHGLAGYKTIVVIDDLTTTGATLKEAGRALQQAISDSTPIIALAVSKVPLSFHRE